MGKAGQVRLARINGLEAAAQDHLQGRCDQVLVLQNFLGVGTHRRKRQEHRPDKRFVGIGRPLGDDHVGPACRKDILTVVVAMFRIDIKVVGHIGQKRRIGPAGVVIANRG